MHRRISGLVATLIRSDSFGHKMSLSTFNGFNLLSQLSKMTENFPSPLKNI